MESTDGDIGKVEDFYFENTTWIIRYLILKTGNWFLYREVIIASQAILSLLTSRKGSGIFSATQLICRFPENLFFSTRAVQPAWSWKGNGFLQPQTIQSIFHRKQWKINPVDEVAQKQWKRLFRCPGWNVTENKFQTCSLVYSKRR